DKLLPFGLPPDPVRPARVPWPIDSNQLSGLELGGGLHTIVLVPNDFSPDRIDHEIQLAVVVPVGDAQRRIAPFCFARTLNRAVGAGHDADRLPVRFQTSWSGPF